MASGWVKMCPAAAIMRSIASGVPGSSPSARAMWSCRIISPPVMAVSAAAAARGSGTSSPESTKYCSVPSTISRNCSAAASEPSIMPRPT